MVSTPRCERCGSAGSIEFDMCQVCYFDYSRSETAAEAEPGRRLYAVGGRGRSRDLPPGGLMRRRVEESLAGGIKAG